VYISIYIYIWPSPTKPVCSCTLGIFSFHVRQSGQTLDRNYTGQMSGYIPLLHPLKYQLHSVAAVVGDSGTAMRWSGEKKATLVQVVESALWYKQSYKKKKKATDQYNAPCHAMAHAIPSRIKQLGGICNTKLTSPPNYLFPNYLSERKYEILLLLSQAMFKPSFQSWRQSLQSFWLLLPIPKASGDPLPLTMSDVLVSWIILKVVLVFGCQHHKDTQWCVTLTDLTCRGVAGGASGLKIITCLDHSRRWRSSFSDSTLSRLCHDWRNLTYNSDWSGWPSDCLSLAVCFLGTKLCTVLDTHTG